jgi:hypothetical protein
MDSTRQNTTTSTSAERCRQYRLRKKREREDKAVEETQTPQVCEPSTKRSNGGCLYLTLLVLRAQQRAPGK